jgi:hypothetical protein
MHHYAEMADEGHFGPALGTSGVVVVCVFGVV